MSGTYPLNAWYAAAWEHELARAPLARTICDVPIVLYRTADRSPVALENACLHRLLPLSMGAVQGDAIVCGYHGMAFGPDGRCVRMPVPSEEPARGARVKSFPLVRRHNMIWIWPGDPAAADAAHVPDLHWADDPEWATEGNMLEMACDYRLVLDNLMDLTHETFVHASSIGHSTILDVPFEVSHDADRVRLSRWMIDTDAPPFLAMQLRLARGLPPEHVDRWQIIDFTAPATVVIDVGVAATGTGAPRGDRSRGVSGTVLNTMTPKGDGSCYYFFAFARSFSLDDRALTTEIKLANTGIFLEDKTILEAQQVAIDRLPHRRLLNIGIDQGSMRARRAVERMIAAEQPVIENPIITASALA